MKEIYLDNSATTRVSDAAVSKMLYMMTENYGNPSSLHTKGFEAEKELKAAREYVAQLINADKSEIVFTSGGTESNNTAIMGAAKHLSRFGNHIVTTAIEHHSVLNTMKQLEKEGFSVTYVKPDETGNISPESIEKELTDKTVLVSVMAVNNEVGSVLPVTEISKLIKKHSPRAYFHVDAVQAFGKIPINVKKSGIDLLSASAHKMHGPKGVGLLYISKSVKIPPLIFGGGQEKGMRSGTEAMPAICGFGAAALECRSSVKALNLMKENSELLIKLLKDIDGVVINSPENALPYIVNFSVPGIRSEVLLHFLSSFGIYVSSGSACAGGEKSHVLSAMGLSKERIDSAIRVSFSTDTAKEDIYTFAQKLKEGTQTLVRTDPFRKGKENKIQ